MGQTKTAKAEQIKKKALTTFEKAVEEVEKANALIAEDIANDQDTIKNIENNIADQYEKLDELNESVKQKKEKMVDNRGLIQQLSQFTSTPWEGEDQ